MTILIALLCDSRLLEWVAGRALHRIQQVGVVTLEPRLLIEME